MNSFISRFRRLSLCIHFWQTRVCYGNKSSFRTLRCVLRARRHKAKPFHTNRRNIYQQLIGLSKHPGWKMNLNLCLVFFAFTLSHSVTHVCAYGYGVCPYLGRRGAQLIAFIAAGRSKIPISLSERASAAAHTIRTADDKNLIPMPSENVLACVVHAPACDISLCCARRSLSLAPPAACILIRG